MFVLFLCQLALVIFIWLQRDQILQAFDKAMKTIWDQSKSDRGVMDGIELSVSYNMEYVFAILLMNLYYKRIAEMLRLQWTN